MKSNIEKFLISFFALLIDHAYHIVFKEIEEEMKKGLSMEDIKCKLLQEIKDEKSLKEEIATVGFCIKGMLELGDGWKYLQGMDDRSVEVDIKSIKEDMSKKEILSNEFISKKLH